MHGETAVRRKDREAVAASAAGMCGGKNVDKTRYSQEKRHVERFGNDRKPQY